MATAAVVFIQRPLSLSHSHRGNHRSNLGQAKASQPHVNLNTRCRRQSCFAQEFSRDKVEIAWPSQNDASLHLH
eukprot:6176707-Pleurochrysis_carterae.AAC.3